MFITLEGVEGSGKTTQMGAIAQFLEENGHDVLLTREPGATHTGQKIRSILLDPDNDSISPLCELLLYGADRAQHLDEVVLPALRSGRTVLCDRFADATTAYQGVARGLDMALIDNIHTIVAGRKNERVSLNANGSNAEGHGNSVNFNATDFDGRFSGVSESNVTVCKPDVTILFDIDPLLGLQRTFDAIDQGERAHNESRFEQEALAFHKRVRHGYLEIAKQDPERFIIIDASLPKQSVFEEVVSKLGKFVLHMT